jgi:hypothetical protein
MSLLATQRHEQRRLPKPKVACSSQAGTANSNNSLVIFILGDLCAIHDQGKRSGKQTINVDGRPRRLRQLAVVEAAEVEVPACGGAADRGEIAGFGWNVIAAE